MMNTIKWIYVLTMLSVICISNVVKADPGIRFSQHEQLCDELLMIHEEELTQNITKLCQYVDCNKLGAKELCPEKCIENKGCHDVIPSSCSLAKKVNTCSKLIRLGKEIGISSAQTCEIPWNFLYREIGECANSTRGFIKDTCRMSCPYQCIGNETSSKGDISIEVKLPFISVDNEIYKIKYSLDKPKLNNATKKNSSLDQTTEGLLKFYFTTPIASIRKVLIEHKMTSELYSCGLFGWGQCLSELMLNFGSYVNDREGLLVDYEYIENKNTSFRIKSNVFGDLIREVIFNYKAMGDHHAEFSLKGKSSKFDLLGHLAESYEEGFISANFNGLREYIIFHVENEFEISVYSKLTENTRILFNGDKILGIIPSSILIENKSNPIFKFRAEHEEKYNSLQRKMVKMKFDVYHPMSFGPLAFHNFMNSNVSVAYDLTQEIKKISVKLSHGSQFFGVVGTFKYTEDTFDGRFVLKNSASWLNNVKFGLKYDISVKPSITLVCERNGNRKRINVEKSFNNGTNLIVKIKTPVVGYENIIFSGSYKSNNNNKTIELTFSTKDKEFARLINHVSANDDYTKFSLISTLIADARGNLPLQIEIAFDAVAPHSAKIKIMDGDVEYSANGSPKELLSFVFNVIRHYAASLCQMMPAPCLVTVGIGLNINRFVENLLPILII